MKQFMIVYGPTNELISGDIIEAENELEAHRKIRADNEEKLIEVGETE